MSERYKIITYSTEDGKTPLEDWLLQLKDAGARLRILRRIQRLELGNFGDHKGLKNGVCELRIDHGPGYRIYYSKQGDTIVLLLCGGDKRRQDDDILRAVEYKEDFKRRNK